jgi:hypothetical protein
MYTYTYKNMDKYVYFLYIYIYIRPETSGTRHLALRREVKTRESDVEMAAGCNPSPHAPPPPPRSSRPRTYPIFAAAPNSGIKGTD